MLSNVSYRHKIPASLTLVIVVTAMAVAVPLISDTKEATKRELIEHALSLGKTLSRTLQPAMLHDDMWQAYEVIKTPFDTPPEQRRDQPTIVVVDAQGAVYVATDPKRFPATQPLSSLGPLAAKLAETIKSPGETPAVLEGLDPTLTVMTIPVLSNDHTQLGTVVLEYPRAMYQDRFLETVRKAGVSTALVLLVLVPLGWLWGKRIAGPLLQLSSAIGQVAQKPPTAIAFKAPPGKDEIAELGATFNLSLIHI